MLLKGMFPPVFVKSRFADLRTETSSQGGMCETLSLGSHGPACKQQFAEEAATAELIASLCVSLCSDASDPESDDGDDQAARDAVSSFQRRASLSPLKEGREPEEHSPELCGLGVGRGSTTHDERPAVFVLCSSGLVSL